MKHLGYKVHIEESGLKGIDAVLKNKFDLILMDIELPGIKGVETMKLIHTKNNSKIPIVALTAFAMKGDMEKYLSEGFDGYISKPIIIEKLKDTLDSLLK